MKGLDESSHGLTWHAEKFSTDMDSRLNPEAKVGQAQRGGFQMKVGYFIVPESKLSRFSADSLSPHVLKEMEVNDKESQETCYRFFVHPKAYKHFAGLHRDPAIQYVAAEHSEFMGTPTSSYRSWVVRRVDESQKGWEGSKGATPFIIKLGVEGSVLGSDRWLSPNEIERSVQAQVAFDNMPKMHFKKGHAGADLDIFGETFGLVLQHIESYSEKKLEEKNETKESGLLIREFPASFLKGKSRIVSMAALMSPERVKREHTGLCSAKIGAEVEQLPLIFEIMLATIRAGKVSSPEEFIHKYLIQSYLQSIEEVVFQEGLTLEPHSQNLCMVLNPDSTPRGFAYRDHGGIWVDIATRGLQNKDISPFYRTQGDGNKIFKTKGAIAKGYIGSFSWFYRYQVFVKLLNAMTKLDKGSSEWMEPPTGAPIQIGSEVKMPERNLRRYIVSHLNKGETQTYQAAKKALNNLSLTLEQYQKAISLLDESYLKTMDRYFDLNKIQLTLEQGALPSAEGGSTGDHLFYQHKGFLGKYRFNLISSGGKRLGIDQIPFEWLEKFKKRVITSFEKQTFDDVQPKECKVLDKGLCFFNVNNEIVAFMPYQGNYEKKWFEELIENDAE